MESFAREFGEYDEREEVWALPGWLSSVMTATPFLGKAIVCVWARSFQEEQSC